MLYGIFINGGHAKNTGTECMQAKLMRHCYIVSFDFFPHKPRLHALGPIILRVSAIYKYGLFFKNGYIITLLKTQTFAMFLLETEPRSFLGILTKDDQIFVSEKRKTKTVK